jgi:hypothetical protein
MNHPFVTMPADDIAGVTTFILIALALAAIVAALEIFSTEKPRRRK